MITLHKLLKKVNIVPSDLLVDPEIKNISFNSRDVDKGSLFLGLPGMNDDGTLEIYDWKRCKEIKKTNAFENAKTECISYMPNSNFWHYSLQLNTYKALIEKNYDKVVNGMYLVCLHPNNSNGNWLRFKVPNLSNEIADLFELRKQQLNN